MKALYLDYPGLKKIAFDKVQIAESKAILKEYNMPSCQHINAYVDSSHAYYFVNNPNNNIDVYKIVSPNS